MARITDNPKDGFEFEINRYFVKDEQVFVRYNNRSEVSLYDFIRTTIKNVGLGNMVDNLSDAQVDSLMYQWFSHGNTTVRGIVASLYMAATFSAEMREALKED